MVLKQNKNTLCGTVTHVDILLLEMGDYTLALLTDRMTSTLDSGKLLQRFSS